ncbi:maleylpyruvate isomerase N-terminal domain-containing protein, partial [Streptomyces asoensis]|uniref:maleylpyruvate isomerase N-terminal domain-containing protein n=1 Tax=Streptomyces asoensis TaxID=249586 RepID=UPI0033F2E4DF
MTTDTTAVPTLDLGPQTLIVARLAEGVRDEQLAHGTPCPGCAVRNMLGHLTGLSGAFRDAARKDLGPTTDTAPDAAAPDIGPGWRAELSKALDGLAAYVHQDAVDQLVQAAQRHGEGAGGVREGDR